MPWLFEVIIEDARDHNDIKMEHHWVEAESLFDVAESFRFDDAEDDRTVVTIARHVPISRCIGTSTGL